MEDIIGGYEVRTAATGEEGLRVWEEFKPDIIISDIDMPGMDGFEMVKRIREIDRETPVLFASALTSPKDVRKGYEMGVNNYIKKPFIADELDAHMKAILKLKEGVGSRTETGFCRFGHYTLDTEHADSGNALTPRALALLQERGAAFFFSEPGQAEGRPGVYGGEGCAHEPSGQVPGGFHACARRSRGGLHVHGEPAPADDERAEGEVGRRGRAAAQRAYAAAYLQKAGQERRGRAQLKAGAGGQATRQAGEDAGRAQRRRYGGEDDDKAADVEYVAHGGRHGPGQGAGGGRLRGDGRDGRCAAPAAQEQPGRNRGQDMAGVQYQARAGAAEYAHPGGADQEGRAGVVDEAQQPLTLRARYHAAPAQPRCRGRAQRVAAEDAYDQCRGPGPGDAEKPRHRL